MAALVLGGLVVTFIVAFFVGVACSDATRVARLARKSGWTRSHRKIYKRSIATLSKMVDIHDLDAGMDPLLRQVILSEAVRSEIQAVLNDYRKEIDA